MGLTSIGGAQGRHDHGCSIAQLCLHMCKRGCHRSVSFTRIMQLLRSPAGATVQLRTASDPWYVMQFDNLYCCGAEGCGKCLRHPRSAVVRGVISQILALERWCAAPSSTIEKAMASLRADLPPADPSTFCDVNK